MRWPLEISFGPLLFSYKCSTKLETGERTMQTTAYTRIYKKKETLRVSGKYIKKNWRAAGLELSTIAPSRTIVTDGNC